MEFLKKFDPFWKLILGTASVCALYYGQQAQTDKVLSKLDEFIAKQQGRDNVQDVITSQNSKDITTMSLKVDQWISRDIKKPDPIRIESQ